MRRQSRITLILLGLLALTAQRARAQGNTEAPRTLTSEGRTMVSGTVDAHWSNDRGGEYGSMKRWLVHASPELTYFIYDHVGLGLVVGGGVGQAGSSSNALGTFDQRDSNFTVGLRGAFEVPRSARLGLLFRPFLGYLHQWRKESGSDFDIDRSAPGSLVVPTHITLHSQLSYARAGLALQLLVHLSDSVAIGFGPDAWVDIFIRQRSNSNVAASITPIVGNTRRHAPTRLQLGLSSAILISF